jgi:hypothetical protein
MDYSLIPNTHRFHCYKDCSVIYLITVNRIHDFVLSNGYRSIPEIYYAIYIIWCLLGYICSCFLHTLDRLVRGYKLSRLNIIISEESYRNVFKTGFIIIHVYCSIKCGEHNVDR